MGLGWASVGPQMTLTWASDGPQVGLGWASDGQQKVQEEVLMVSNGFQNTSLFSDRIQICFVDGFERQQVALAFQMLSAPRAQDYH